MLLPSVTVMEGVCKKGDQQLNQEIPENTVGSTLNLIIMSVILTFWQGKQMVYACMILGVWWHVSKRFVACPPGIH